MSKIKNLIKRTGGSESESEHAVIKLVEYGMQAVQPVIDAIHEGSPGNVSKLCTVLFQLNDQEIAPVLIELMDDKNSDLAGDGSGITDSFQATE